MRIAMYYNNNDIRIEEVPLPAIGPGELLIKIVASGICGSDVMEWYRIKKAPLVLGHEIAGIVAQVGEGVKGFVKGNRVIATHHVPCNNCAYCQRGQYTLCSTLHNTKYYPGGFVEYVRVPAINIEKGGVIKLPAGVSFDAGTFVEPLGCVVRGMRELLFEPARTVLVLGSGLSGILNIKTAKAYAAGKVLATDIDPFRLEMARQAGAKIVINASEEDVTARVLKETGGLGADYVIATASAPTAFHQAMKSVKPGGKVLLFGIMAPDTKISFDVFSFWQKQVQLLSTYAASPRDLADALELLQTHQIEVEKMITHRLPLAEIQKGFQLTASPKHSLKVIIELQH